MKGGIIMKTIINGKVCTTVIRYTCYYKDDETGENFKIGTYFRDDDEPLKDTLKFFDEKIKRFRRKEIKKLECVYFSWSRGAKNYCYNAGLLWY